MRRPVLGLDFGTCALKAALVENGKITRLVEEPMPEQLVRDGVVTSGEAMATFLRSALKDNHVSCHRAAVILPPSQVFVQRTELPAMSVTQLELNLPYEFRDFIPENREQYFYDYAVISMENDEDGKPKSMRLICAAARKELIRNYEAMCRWAGLKLVTAIPVELAYANLLRRYKPEETDLAFVDAGHTGLRVHFFSNGVYETATTSEGGGASLDALLAEKLDIDSHIAHVRKEANVNGEMDDDDVRAHFQELLLPAQRAVNFYNFSNPELTLAGLYLCGGGSRVPDVAGQLEGLTGLPTHPLSRMVTDAPDENIVGSCAAAIGAAIQ